MSAKRWFIVTNTENLEFYFNCGLIVDKQGFSEGTYIDDVLTNAPVGYLSCFPETNLWGALKAAKIEDQNLHECLLEIEIKHIDSPAFYRTRIWKKGYIIRSISKAVLIQTLMRYPRCCYQLRYR